jgi:sugar phosphate isomerase/epimerase
MNRFDMGVGVELDIFRSSVAGVDPVSVFESFPGRVPLVHLKDKAENTPIVYSEQEVPVESFLEVGSGVLDIPAVLSAAEKAGSEHLFVEQDHCPGDPLASLKKSIDYLQSV